MNIQNLLRECVIALFSSRTLERTLVLKGGTALHLLEGLESRISTDIDFSVLDSVKSPEKYFLEVEKTLAKHFLVRSIEIFDAKYFRKPKGKSKQNPEFWGGWCFEFKISPLEKKRVPLEKKRREAIIPQGMAGSTIRIEISEYEYCGAVERIELGGSTIVAYSSHLLILEKMRAICQQHPEYPYGRQKDRSRDFYDIYNLVKKYRSDPSFWQHLKDHLEPVFDAKKVNTSLLDKIFDADFLEFQGSHFKSVVDTVSGKVEVFDFYVEQLRLVVAKIKP